MTRTRRLSNSRLFGAIVATLLALGGVAYTAGSGSARCEPTNEAAIVESADFTPYDVMRTKPQDPRLPESAANAAVPSRARYAASSIDGQSRQLVIEATDRGIYSYFLGRPLNGLTVSDFHAIGGVQLHQEPLMPDGSFASLLLTELGERAVPVAVGPFDGAMTWGDPDVNGTRVHGLYWSDGEYNYALIADRPAERLLTIGRGLVCN